MFDPRQFLRADPRLLHDKHLSDRAWLAYCWLELIAGRSRLVKAASRKLSEELHWTHEEAHQAIAELQRKHPGYCEYDGGLHLRATPQQWVQVYRWLLDAQEFRTWEKRLFCYLSDRERRIHRETAFRQAHVSLPETFHRVNLTRILQACPVPAPRGRNHKNDRIGEIKGALRHFASLRLVADLDLGRPGRAGSLRLRPTLYRRLADAYSELLGDRAVATAAVTHPGAPQVPAAEPARSGAPGAGGPAPQVGNSGAPGASGRAPQVPAAGRPRCATPAPQTLATDSRKKDSRTEDSKTQDSEEEAKRPPIGGRAQFQSRPSGSHDCPDVPPAPEAIRVGCPDGPGAGRQLPESRPPANPPTSTPTPTAAGAKVSALLAASRSLPEFQASRTGQDLQLVTDFVEHLDAQFEPADFTKAWRSAEFGGFKTFCWQFVASNVKNLRTRLAKAVNAVTVRRQWTSEDLWLELEFLVNSRLLVMSPEPGRAETTPETRRRQAEQKFLGLLRELFPELTPQPVSGGGVEYRHGRLTDEQQDFIRSRWHAAPVAAPVS